MPICFVTMRDKLPYDWFGCLLTTLGGCFALLCTVLGNISISHLFANIVSSITLSGANIVQEIKFAELSGFAQVEIIGLRQFMLQ